MGAALSAHVLHTLLGFVTLRAPLLFVIVAAAVSCGAPRVTASHCSEPGAAPDASTDACAAFITAAGTAATMADESKTDAGATGPHESKRARTDTRRTVGVVGYGHLGQYLVAAMLDDANPAAAVLRVGWVWNRSPEALKSLPEQYRLTSLDDFAAHPVDVIIEVAHPSITAKYGAAFVRHADFVSGSPTAFADAGVEAAIRAAAAETSGHGVYIPSGAMWGAQVRRGCVDEDRCR